MKKNVLLVIICLISSCNSHHSLEDQEEDKGQEVLTKEEQLKKLYTLSVVPLFEDMENLNIPEELIIDEKDLNINAGAAFNYVEVSRGLVDSEKVPIQIFVLAHEVSHIATLSQAQKFNLKGELPAGAITNEYKKAEFLADLIAMHLIMKKLPAHFDLLTSEFDYLKGLLGSETFTHPSGRDRMDSLKLYFSDSTQTNNNSFRDRFINIWEMK